MAAIPTSKTPRLGRGNAANRLFFPCVAVEVDMMTGTSPKRPNSRFISN